MNFSLRRHPGIHFYCGNLSVEVAMTDLMLALLAS